MRKVAAGQHLPLHRLLEHRRGGRRRVAGKDRSGGGRREQHRPRGRPGPAEGVHRAVATPRKEDRRLVQGQGVFVDDIKRHGMGYVQFVRSPYAHAKIRSVDVSKALEAPGVYGTLTGDEVAILTDPFFQISSPPGGHVKDYALAVGKARFVGEPVVAVVAETRELARDAGRARRGRVRAAAGRRRTRATRWTTTRRCSTTRPAATCLARASTTGATSSARSQRRGPRRADRRAPLRPLQLDAARARRRGGRVQPRHRAVDDLQSNNQFPGFAVDHDGPGDAGRARQAPLRHAGHRRRLRQQDHLAPAPRRVLPPRAEARAARSTGPSGGPTSTRTCRTATSAGSRTSRSP